jgi:hypothetical protein
MAYRSGNILNADPAAELISQIEGTFADHTGNWEFVEEVTISTLPHRVWRNRGTGATNNNSWGVDFYISIWKVSTTEIRIKCFESWDATNKKVIRPCRSSSTALSLNANYSWGDETNGQTLEQTTSGNTSTTGATYAGFGTMATTGFDYFIVATKDQLRVALKIGASDYAMGAGVFETLLTASPAELFPLYLQDSGTGGNFAGAGGQVAWSRHPNAANLTATSGNLNGGIPNISLSPIMGGIGSTAVDRFHGSSHLMARPLIRSNSSSASDGGNFGYYRGLMYDTVILANNGGTTRNGDTVTLGSDVYVKMTSGSTPIHWVKRDAV